MHPRSSLPLQWTVDTAERREATAQRLALSASQRRHPLKSLAAFASGARRRGMRDELVSKVIDRATDIVREMSATSPPADSHDAWLSVAQAARALGVPVAWVREHLASPEGRRLLGYPAFLAGRWRIPGAACSPEHRSLYLASLPASEPPENVLGIPGA